MRGRHSLWLACGPARSHFWLARGPARFGLCLLLCALIAACGGARGQGDKSRRAIDGLRERAAAHPNDAGLWTELAIAEHFEDGGEPKRAREALARATKLNPKSLRLLLVAAEEHVLEGRPTPALDAYLAIVERSAGHADPLAPILAEAALSSINDMNDSVDDYRTRVRAALTAQRAGADKLGLTAAHQLRMQLLGHAMLQGKMAEADALAKEAGCVQSAQVAGPFGPRELLGFDQTWPAEKQGALDKSYDLGPGRGVVATRKLETRRCVLGLGRGVHDALPGTSVVRSELKVDKAGVYALRIESPNSLVLWLDGKQLFKVDMRAQHASGVRYIPVELSAGDHELKAKISSRHPNPALSLALVPGQSAAITLTQVPEPSDGFTRYLAAKVALSRGDAVSSRELLRKAAQTAPSAHWLVLEAAASLADPLQPAELRRDRARELLRKAQQQNADAWYPTVGIANLEAAEGHLKEAIEALRAASAHWPEVIAVRTSLIDQLRERGYQEEADQRIEELHKRMPHACAALNLSLSSARARGRMAEVVALTEPAMQCDASSTVRLGLLKTQRKYDAAAAELLRLRSLGDHLDEAQRIESDLEHARLAGDKAKERSLREERTRFWPDRPEPVLDHADSLLANGKKTEALGYLASALKAHPDDLYELRRVRESLGGEELFAGFRKNGAEIIRNFKASGKKYDEPQVLVLDYTVVRVFEDGSSVDLTHNILRMQSQEAVDANGEFSVPEGARVLTLHTIKPDGRTLEPDAISGKDTLSLPNLALEDYVEFETVRGESPSLGFPGGFLGNRFYFKSFEVPFDHTELVVVLPAGMEPVLDPRGPAPKTIRETKDGLTVLRWFVDESRPLTPEPQSVASREFLPSINLGVKVGWAAYVESLRDLLADKDVYDPAAHEAVNALLGNDIKAPASVRADKLYRWVTDQIEPTEDAFGVAPAMLLARTGNRERVLKYMLALAGIPSELALVRGIEADHSKALLPDPETYGYLMLRVQTERGPVWLHAGARHAPFGYLPPQVRGEQALMLNPQAEMASTPKNDPEQDARNIDVEVALAKDGSAKLHVRETHRGQSAVAWRNDLDEIPQAELEARFEESYAANVVPGARLTALTIEKREAPEEPLVIDYELAVDHLGHRVGSQQRIAGLFPSSLAGTFARPGSRSTTELLASSIASDVRVHVSVPDGAKVASLPKAIEAREGGLQFTSTARLENQKVELARRLRVPQMRIDPKAYPAFSGFCRAVDVGEAGELAIELP